MESLKLGPSLLIQAETSSGVLYYWGTSKKGSLGWKYVDEGFRLKQLLLYLGNLVRVFLIRSPRMQGQPYVHKVKTTYAGSSPRTHDAWQKPILPCFKHSFNFKVFLWFLQPEGSSKTYSKHKISSIQEAKL